MWTFQFHSLGVDLLGKVRLYHLAERVVVVDSVFVTAGILLAVMGDLRWQVGRLPEHLKEQPRDCGIDRSTTTADRFVNEQVIDKKFVSRRYWLLMLDCGRAQPKVMKRDQKGTPRQVLLK